MQLEQHRPAGGQQGAPLGVRQEEPPGGRDAHHVQEELLGGWDEHRAQEEHPGGGQGEDDHPGPTGLVQLLQSASDCYYHPHVSTSGHTC